MAHERARLGSDPAAPQSAPNDLSQQQRGGTPESPAVQILTREIVGNEQAPPDLSLIDYGTLGPGSISPDLESSLGIPNPPDFPGPPHFRAGESQERARLGSDPAAPQSAPNDLSQQQRGGIWFRSAEGLTHLVESDLTTAFLRFLPKTPGMGSTQTNPIPLPMQVEAGSFAKILEYYRGLRPIKDDSEATKAFGQRFIQRISELLEVFKLNVACSRLKLKELTELTNWGVEKSYEKFSRGLITEMAHKMKKEAEKSSIHVSLSKLAAKKSVASATKVIKLQEVEVPRTEKDCLKSLDEIVTSIEGANSSGMKKNKKKKKKKKTHKNVQVHTADHEAANNESTDYEAANNESTDYEIPN